MAFLLPIGCSAEVARCASKSMTMSGIFAN
jgi:hypothetical protein